MLDSREVLTVVQIALTILLVTGAGLFARTLQNLRDADMGFDRDHILLASIDPARSGYTRPRTAVFFAELLQRLRSHENIEAAGLASHGTLSGVLPAGTRFMSTQMHAGWRDGAVNQGPHRPPERRQPGILRSVRHLALARPAFHRARSRGERPGRRPQ